MHAYMFTEYRISNTVGEEVKIMMLKRDNYEKWRI
jgi:hypothetical protein